LNLDPTLVAARLAYRRGDFPDALSLYKLAATGRELDLLAILRFGSCLLTSGDVERAIDQLEAGLKLAPGDFGLLIHLACAKEIQGQEAEAAKLYRTIIARSPNASVAFVNLGYLMLTRGNTAGAVDCLQRGLDAPPAYVETNLILPTFKVEVLPAPKVGSPDPALSMALVMLGLKLQESGRFEEARTCFLQATLQNGRNGSAYGALALASKITKEQSPLVDRMLELSKARDIDIPNRTRLYFALGKAMDDLGEYKTAISYFEEGHRLGREQSAAPFDRVAFETEVDSIIRASDYVDDEGELLRGSDSDLPILIVGMMRSGTTLVEQILSSHPEVAAGEELAFWRDHGFRQLRVGLGPPTKQEATELALAYTTLLREIDPDSQRVTDKMPHNFMAIGLANRVFPNSRIVCCRRHPIDICLSIYMTDFRHPIPFVNTRGDLVFFYQQFERLMDHWHKVIPADRLIDVRYEDLLNDREAITRRLVDFCGLEWDDACLRPEDNRRAVKTASVWQVRQKVYSTSLERWRRYEPWLGEFQSLLS